MSKIATVGSTRQWIEFKYSTNTYSNKKYEDWSRASYLEIIQFFKSIIDPDYTPKFAQIWKKLKSHHWTLTSSPVTNSNGILTNINVT